MILVLDEFFKDPYDVRRIALQGKKNYILNDGRYPGLRWSSLPEDPHPEFPSSIANYITAKVRYYAEESDLIFTETSFQYSTKEYRDGAFHHDAHGPNRYTCIIYLSLNAPSNSGTEVCDIGLKEPHSKFYEHLYKVNPLIRRSFNTDPKNFLKMYRYDRMVKKWNSFFKPIIKVPNKFNRCILFDSSRYHRSQRMFGTSIENARLTSVTFLGDKIT